MFPVRRANGPAWVFNRIKKTFGISDDSLPKWFWCAANDLDPTNIFSDNPFWQKSQIVPTECSGLNANANHYGNPRCAGWTPLHEACYLAKPKAVAGIAKLRPDWIGATDALGRTPLRALFLFNDTSPGWKHAGPHLPGAKLAPLGEDETLRFCAHTLLRLGARLHGGELCAAAYLGKHLCCELLANQPCALRDQPDEHFPEWASSQELFVRPIDGLSKLIACALHGMDPSVALNHALASPPEHDDANIRAFARTKNFDLASEFIGKRPWASIPLLLELACTSPNGLDNDRRRQRARLSVAAIVRSPRAPSKLAGYYRGAACGIGALCALHEAADLLSELLAREPFTPAEASNQLAQARILGTADSLGGIAFSALERVALNGSSVQPQPIDGKTKLRL